MRSARVGIALLLGMACGTPRQPHLKMESPTYTITETSDPIPPRAREAVLYSITVINRKTGQPIETGEGRIFANTAEGARTYDGFEKAPQVGVYTARLNFVTSGQWAIGIQFHSDSTKPLEKVEWMQDVLPERSGVH